jgi:hypothetical protein
MTYYIKVAPPDQRKQEPVFRFFYEYYGEGAIRCAIERGPETKVFDTYNEADEMAKYLHEKYGFLTEVHKNVA